MNQALRCEACGTDQDVRISLMFDLCGKCEAGLRAEHETYAAAQAERLSRDAGCPVPERTP